MTTSAARKRFFVAVAALALCLAACGSSGTSTTASSGHVGSAGGSGGTPYRVLDILGTSGQLGPIAAAEVAAVRGSASYINSHGGIDGRQVTVQVVNDQGDATSAVSELANALSSSTKPDLVLPGASSNETLAMLPALKSAGILSIAPTGAPQVGDARTYPLSFGCSFSAQDGPAAMAAHVASTGVKKVALLASSDAFGQSWLSQIKPALSSHGLTETTATYNDTDLDMTPELLQLRAANPGALLLQGFGAPVGPLLSSRAKISWYSTPAIGDLTVSASDVWTIVGDPRAFTNMTVEAYALQDYKPAASLPVAAQAMIRQVTSAGPITQALSIYGCSWDSLQSVQAAAALTHSTEASQLAQALTKLQPGAAAWTQNAGAPPGYTATSHFASANAANYVFIKEGPLSSGMIRSQ